MPTPADTIAILHCKDRQGWTNWLARHHAASPRIWLQIGKKGSGLASLSYPEALEAALCQGWIDGQKKSGDAQSSATIPEDMAALLAGRPGARAFFESLDSRDRYAILFRLQTASKSETRERRLTQFVDMLIRGEKTYP